MLFFNLSTSPPFRPPFRPPPPPPQGPPRWPPTAYVTHAAAISGRRANKISYTSWTAGGLHRGPRQSYIRGTVTFVCNLDVRVWGGRVETQRTKEHEEDPFCLVYITTQPQPPDGGGGGGATLGVGSGTISLFLIPSISLSNKSIFLCASS